MLLRHEAGHELAHEQGLQYGQAGDRIAATSASADALPARVHAVLRFVGDDRHERQLPCPRAREQCFEVCNDVRLISLALPVSGRECSGQVDQWGMVVGHHGSLA